MKLVKMSNLEIEKQGGVFVKYSDWKYKGGIKMEELEKKMNESEERTIQSAEALSEYIATLGLSEPQIRKLNYLILKHVDDCIHWGIQVKLGLMLEEAEK
ncbi:hypothetical protein MWG07_09290 [Fusobacterium necrophorum]|uniref:Uncharacterized protein n=1 Tax=Fusobacterium necrophorum TaxID=859 RepID=A0AAW6WDI3_9FUSO|nr:hypothetical protein [Fusobacterium necrophorum]MDK4481214.1 hypothetical protein [Fusobacterium necrophorum]MDK4512440.1 hypothetical protein [Fusobacterium necrophorum]